MKEPKSRPGNRVYRFFAELGPGLITGAADDDPSGISTYSVAGASFGYASLWTALFSFPLMASVQLMCARLGQVTGRGLAGIVRRRYPRWILWGACVLLGVANTFNIGADLAGMAEATEMLTGINSLVWAFAYAVAIIALMFWSSYRRFSRILKWLTMALFAYIVAAILAHPDWMKVIRFTLLPHFVWSRSYMATIVAIFGTTISPYLFFWQAAQEVEEDRAHGKTTLKQRKGASNAELRRSRTDVMTGMACSNLVMYFIILTTATTLNAHGLRNIATAQQAAESLRPLAGNAASLIFASGLIGTGMLAIPVLAGSCAYAISEAVGRRGSLEDRPTFSNRFYWVVTISMILGMALDFAGISAVTMLFGAAVLNGILAPPLVVLVVLLSGDAIVMQDRVNSRALNSLGWLTAAVMTLGVILMFAA